LATDVIMPRLSDSMEEGTVLKWLVEVGGEVKRGEPLAEIETDKANMTFEADTDGTLIEIVANEGDTLPIGEVIARVGDPDEAPTDGGESDGGGESETGTDGAEDGASEETAASEEGSEAATATAEASPAADDGGGGGGVGGGGDSDGGSPSGGRAEGTTTTTEDGERLRASPVARRMARELGVELASIEGSGPGGRIVKADVEAAAEGDGAAPAAAEEEPAAAEEQPAAAEIGGARAPDGGAKGRVETRELTRLQKTVARRMAESKATAPDFALEVEIDMGECVELRGRLKAVADPVPSFNDMVVKACALALREHPKVNGAYRDGAFELYERVNVGVAVAGEEALVVPTVFDAGTKSLGEIARDARRVIAKVHDGSISPPELSGGTFTVSNLGMFGIERFTAVINPPQAALLAVGALKKKAVVNASGRVVARDTMSATLVSDHRILYGADAAQFLARVKELLEQPIALAL
jgi:pyruvate dehydrogenase E2 component (dihydrolipoamide acetyltransferase)